MIDKAVLLHNNHEEYSSCIFVLSGIINCQRPYCKSPCWYDPYVLTCKCPNGRPTSSGCVCWRPGKDYTDFVPNFIKPIMVKRSGPNYGSGMDYINSFIPKSIK